VGVRAIRHIMDFLKWRFSLLPFGAFRWVPETEAEMEQAGSEIYIGADTPFRHTLLNGRPAVTVFRGPLAAQGLGIGDLAYHDLATGAQTRMDLYPTTLSINVLARNGIVAERLGEFIETQIFSLRNEITRTEPCILNIGARAMLSPPGPAGKLIDTTAESWSAVSLSMPLYLQRAVTSAPLNRKTFDRVQWSLRPA
jgi:hypothetical protein